MKKLLLGIGVSIMFLLSSCDAIERSMFEDLIKENLYESGYTDYSYYKSQHWSNQTTEKYNGRLYKMGYISDYRFIGYTVLDKPLYEIYLTRETKNLMYKEVFNGYNGNYKRYDFYFITKKYRFLEVTDVEYISDNKVEVKYSMVLDEITELGEELNSDNFEGEVFTGYVITFVDKGYGWIPKGGTIWDEGENYYNLGEVKTHKVENRHLGIRESRWVKVED